MRRPRFHRRQQGPHSARDVFPALVAVLHSRGSSAPSVTTQTHHDAYENTTPAVVCSIRPRHVSVGGVVCSSNPTSRQHEMNQDTCFKGAISPRRPRQRLFDEYGFPFVEWREKQRSPPSGDLTQTRASTMSQVSRRTAVGVPPIFVGPTLACSLPTPPTPSSPSISLPSSFSLFTPYPAHAPLPLSSSPRHSPSDFGRDRAHCGGNARRPSTPPARIVAVADVYVDFDIATADFVVLLGFVGFRWRWPPHARRRS